MAMSEKKEEKQSFLRSESKKKSYGTTRSSSNLLWKTEVVHHDVRPGDTLEGLAVRYGVTAERIRQENKLWSGDSIFSRQQLSIPIQRPEKEKAKPVVSNGTATSADSDTDGDSHQRGDEVAPNFDHSSVSASSFLARFDADLRKSVSTLGQMELSVAQRVEQLGAEANEAADAAAEAHYRKSTQELARQRLQPSLQDRIRAKWQSRKQARIEAKHDELYQL